MESETTKEDLNQVISEPTKAECEVDQRPRVHFNLFSALGITYSVTAVPLAIGSYLTLVVGLGGQPFYLYTFLFVAVFQFSMCLCVAELASGLPHSSGKYSLSSKAKNPRY